jgi:PAS domain S-box-containing protein
VCGVVCRGVWHGVVMSVSDTIDLAERLLEASPDGLLLVDDAGVIRLANSSASELFGLGDLVGNNVDQLVPVEQRAGHAGLRNAYTAQPTSRPMGTGLQLFAQHADGTVIPVEISLNSVEIDGESYTIATVRDVTERQNSAERITLLRERERIARDIHDMVIQRIFAAGMTLQALDSIIENRTAKERIAGVIDDLDETIRQLRQSIFELGQTDDVRTLSSQIAAVIDRRAVHLGFRPHLTVNGSLTGLPDFLADQLVATLTESLSNVARHAGATEASVVIERRADEVCLTVRDNGRGIVGQPKTNGGLSNMMWRAAELGGECAIGAAQPSGTLLTWNVPIIAG